VLDGLIIERGNADGPMNQYDRGGGMYNWLGGPTLRNCTFRLNASTYGGAVYNDASDATFHNCTFEDNQAVIGGGVLFTLTTARRNSSSAASSAIGPPTAEAGRVRHQHRARHRSITWIGQRSSERRRILRCKQRARRITCIVFISNTGTAVSFNNSGHLLFDNCDVRIQYRQKRGCGAIERNRRRVRLIAPSLANQGSSGGALAVLSASVTMDRCVFDSNVSLLGAAGAVLLQSASRVDPHCEFRQ
jgi:hypothetical protein